MTTLDRTTKLAASAVSAIAALGATGAQAAVVATPLASTDTSVSFDNGGRISFADGIGLGTVMGYPFSYANLVASASGDVQVAGTVAAGTTIDSTTNWTTSTEIAAKNIGAAGTLYLPFELTSTSGNEFGFVTVDTSWDSADNKWNFTLDSVTVQDDGTAIAAGAVASTVPEPSSLALLAVGALGLAAYRRRQRA